MAWTMSDEKHFDTNFDPRLVSKNGDMSQEMNQASFHRAAPLVSIVVPTVMLRVALYSCFSIKLRAVSTKLVFGKGPRCEFPDSRKKQ